MRLKIALGMALCMGAPAASAEDLVIGFVKTQTGHATLRRGDVVRDIVPGTPVYEKDLIETASDGRLGIAFRDNTRTAMGPSSRMELTHFVFKPAEKQYGLVLTLARGTLEFITGLTAKLSPQAVSIVMPTGTIGVRGTQFLARAED